MAHNPAMIAKPMKTLELHYLNQVFNYVENTMAFLYSDWLYFLWHGISK